MIKVLKSGTTDEYSRTETQTHLSQNNHISLLARPDRFSADSATSKVVPAILFFSLLTRPQANIHAKQALRAEAAIKLICVIY